MAKKSSEAPWRSSNWMSERTQTAESHSSTKSTLSLLAMRKTSEQVAALGVRLRYATSLVSFRHFMLIGFLHKHLQSITDTQEGKSSPIEENEKDEGREGDSEVPTSVVLFSVSYANRLSAYCGSADGCIHQRWPAQQLGNAYGILTQPAVLSQELT